MRRPQSGTYLSAIPMPSGRGLSAAIIAPLTGFSNSHYVYEPFWAHRVVSAFERTAAQTGLRVILKDQSPRRTDPCSVIDLIRESADEGAKAVVLFHAMGSRQKMTHALALSHDLGMHPVMVSSSTFSGLGSEVYFDSVWGGYLATRNLLVKGHKRIGFIGLAENWEWVRDRLTGYQNAMAASDISPLPEWVRVLPQDQCGDCFEIALSAFEFWSNLDEIKRPTAIFAACDKIALAYRDVAAKNGLSCPRDYSMVGFDNEPEALLAGITTVERPTEALGEAVAKVTLERLCASPCCESVAIRLRPVLIERNSVACRCRE
jgi:LacI family transcriptional regulator